LKPTSGFILAYGERVGKPGPDIVGQISPDRHGVALPVFLVGLIQLGVGVRPVEPQLTDSQRCQLVSAESGQNQRLVNQGSLSTEGVELLPNLWPDVGHGLPHAFASPDGQGVKHGSATSDVEQPAKLVGGHGSLLAWIPMEADWANIFCLIHSSFAYSRSA
jgi:hypothetical protein